MLSPAIVAIMVGSLVLALYFLVKSLCKPKETFDTKPKVMLFKAQWCGHCKKIMPVWDKAAEALKDEAEFIKYDSDADKDKMKEFGIQGFPTIYKEINGERTEFQGERTVAGITAFVRA